MKLGDFVASAAAAAGIKPCGGCKKRQEKLNLFFSSFAAANEGTITMNKQVDGYIIGANEVLDYIIENYTKSDGIVRITTAQQQEIRDHISEMKEPKK